MTSQDYATRDLALFGPRIEQILKESLNHAGIPFHHVEYHPTKDGTAAVEVVSFFSSNFHDIEALIHDLFVVDTERSVDHQTRTQRNEQLPGTYLVHLDPIRRKLPEWKPFAGEPILILVSSLFQGALFSILGFFSGENLPDDPRTDQDIQRFSQMAEELDNGFAALYDHHLGKEDQAALLSSPSSMAKEQPEVTPAGKRPPDAEQEVLDMASVRLYLSAGTRVVAMWLSVASENDITTLPLADTADQEEGLARLFSFLTDHGINSYEAMELYFTEQLGSWEKIYEALEFARASGILASRELGLCDLALTLLKGREAPLFQAP